MIDEEHVREVFDHYGYLGAGHFLEDVHENGWSFARDKIRCIKLLRNQYGVPLRDSKSMMDDIVGAINKNLQSALDEKIRNLEKKRRELDYKIEGLRQIRRRGNRGEISDDEVIEALGNN